LRPSKRDSSGSPQPEKIKKIKPFFSGEDYKQMARPSARDFSFGIKILLAEGFAQNNLIK